MGNQIMPSTKDYSYNGFKFSTVKYTYTAPNVARMFLENISTHDWWCGYVFLPENHQYYGKWYDDIPLEAHGGLTFGDKFHSKSSKNFGEFAIGFDFNHFGDNGGSEELVIKECKKIIGQLKGEIQ